MSSTTAQVIPTIPELARTNSAEILNVTRNRMVKAIERGCCIWVAAHLGRAKGSSPAVAHDLVLILTVGVGE